MIGPSHARGPLVIGLDVGSQSVKLLAYGIEAKQVEISFSAPLQLIAGDDGSREQRAEWWIDAIRACFARLDAVQRERVVAIGVSGQQHGFVPLDATGKVLAPVKLWCDTSTQLECDEIMDAVGGPSRCVALSGNPILAGYTASKLPWTRKHRPEAYARLAHILLPHDYVNFWLTGERWMEAGDASGTGWFDVRTRSWSRALLDATDAERDLADCLPALVASETSFRIAPTSAEELGLGREVLISVGGGDNMMAAIGTGNVQPGMLTMSLGTSGTLFSHSASPLVDEGAGWAAFCSSTDGWLPLICTMNCTVATESVARAFGFSSRDGDALIADTLPGAAGVSMLPFFNGERTPDLPRARASLFGLNPANFSAANVYRAAMEGATYALRNGFDALRGAGLECDAIRLTGGGSHSAAWRQLVADVFERPVEVPEQVEGAAFGAALQALRVHREALGDRAGIAEIARAHVRVDPARSAQPHDDRIEDYRAAYREYTRLLGPVAELYSTHPSTSGH